MGWSSANAAFAEGAASDLLISPLFTSTDTRKGMNTGELEAHSLFARIVEPHTATRIRACLTRFIESAPQALALDPVRMPIAASDGRPGRNVEIGLTRHPT